MHPLRPPFAVLFSLCLAAAPARAEEGAAPAGAVPDLELPTLQELGMQVPRPVKAVNAALGQGRQRLALVLGMARSGPRAVVDSAPRDTQALAAALRASGFVVMLREDVGAAALREALAEFQRRLQPGGLGFAYFTGLGAQVDGRNLLLARDTPLDGPAEHLAARLKAGAVPLQELVDALMGTADSPRLLVVDAAFKHPALAALPQPGLAEQRLPPGMMALFGQALGALQEVPAVAPLPDPAPADPRAIAASDFARSLVGALTKPRVNGAAALREARRGIVDATLGQTNPWIGGDTDDQEEFAELNLVDGLLPSSPQDYAREALKQAARAASRPNAPMAPQALGDGLAQTATPTTPAPGNARIAVPDAPGAPGTLGSVLQGAGGVMGAAGTVAGVAATAGAAAATLQAAQAAATATAASTAVSAVGAAGQVAGQAVALAARTGSGGAAAEPPARQVLQQAAAAPAAPGAEPPVGRVLAEAPRPPVAAPPAPALPDTRTTPSPEGGERPLYTPRINPNGYAEGDTFTYQVRDTWKDEILGGYTTAIEEVLEDGQLLANGQQVEMDAQGRVKRQQTPEGGLSQFEPAQELWWSRPRPGERRSARFVEKYQRPGSAPGEIEFKGSSKVGRLRRIETPAGAFEALPIETSGWSYESLRGGHLLSRQFSRTVWYAPQLGHPVAIDIEDADHLGRLLRRERVELMHVQQAPRSAP